ncbi:1908_t:CDS:2 [Funneliformis geosporum]|uniref:1908_t:CDS:1 n=1 Tax=Funneliformis geosporum TaxID=1117311 RepID=A0A9W4SYZ0_9GLOM|nr:1908_t:CDS:2 [Funneliformis geosporum]
MTVLNDTKILAENNDAPNMQALEKAMSTAFNKFAECKQLKIDNSNFISEKIKEIEEESNSFKEHANNSIKQSDKLSKYAEEVVVFAVACADPSFTKGELLDFLKSTLEDAKNNKTEAENLKAKISGIAANLTNIHNDCSRYASEIKTDARKIDSTTVNKLEKVESKQRILDKTCKIGTGVAILGGAVSIIAAPFTGGTSLVLEAIALLEGGLIVAGSTGAIALGSKFALRKENNEIIALNKQLTIERDQLSSHIELLNKNLSSIVHETSGIINFWGEQITSLNEIIEKLERFDNQADELLSRLEALSIQRKWKNVSRGCKEYNCTIRTVLQTSNMILNQDRHLLMSGDGHCEITRYTWDGCCKGPLGNIYMLEEIVGERYRRATPKSFANTRFFVHTHVVMHNANVLINVFTQFDYKSSLEDFVSFRGLALGSKNFAFSDGAKINFLPSKMAGSNEYTESLINTANKIEQLLDKDNDGYPSYPHPGKPDKEQYKKNFRLAVRIFVIILYGSVTNKTGI